MSCGGDHYEMLLIVVSVVQQPHPAVVLVTETMTV